MKDIQRDILTQASQGDRGAFEQVYRHYAGYVYTISLGIVRSSFDANEIVQDVFLKLHRELKKFEFRSSFKTWIYRIAVNMSLTRAKQLSLRWRNTVSIDNLSLAGSMSSAPEQQAITQERSHVVHRLLHTLTPEQRACMVLRHLEGMRYQEIADTLNVNINTVRTRLKRAREQLIKTKEVILNEV